MRAYAQITEPQCASSHRVEGLTPKFAPIPAQQPQRPMAEDYTRVLARVAAGQLAEIAGYEAVQESAVEILADLLLHYLSELSSGANAYANLASRSDINVNDVALAIEDLGSSVEELAAYASSLSSVSACVCMGCAGHAWCCCRTGQ